MFAKAHLFRQNKFDISIKRSSMWPVDIEADIELLRKTLGSHANSLSTNINLQLINLIKQVRYNKLIQKQSKR